MTLAEIAEALGVSITSVHRDEANALAKLHAGLADAGDPDLVARAIVFVLVHFPRKKSANAIKHETHAELAADDPHPAGHGGPPRQPAGSAPIPRRWSKP